MKSRIIILAALLALMFSVQAFFSGAPLRVQIVRGLVSCPLLFIGGFLFWIDIPWWPRRIRLLALYALVASVIDSAAVAAVISKAELSPMMVGGSMVWILLLLGLLTSCVRLLERLFWGLKPSRCRREGGT